MTFPFCYVNKIIRDDQNLGKDYRLKHPNSGFSSCEMTRENTVEEK